MQTSITKATATVANSLAQRLINADMQLTYWTCHTHLANMARAGENNKIIAGLVNVRSLYRATSAFLISRGHNKLISSKPLPTPQQRMMLQRFDRDDPFALRDASPRVLRNCKALGWMSYTNCLWRITREGKDAARGQYDYWRP
jgi:hypothetical protein